MIPVDKLFFLSTLMSLKHFTSNSSYWLYRKEREKAMCDQNI